MLGSKSKRHYDCALPDQPVQPTSFLLILCLQVCSLLLKFLDELVIVTLYFTQRCNTALHRDCGT